MDKVLTYREFVNESSLADMGYSGYGYDAAGVKDKEMGVNPYTQYITDLKQSYLRLQGILNGIFNNTFLKNQSDFAFKIENLMIIRIFKNDSNSLDIYIKFDFEDKIFYGNFKNWGLISNPIFNSPVLYELPIRAHMENAIKLEGILKQSLIDWFRPELDEYRALKEIRVYDESGNICYIPEGGKITVDEVLSEEDKPIIYLTYSNKRYFITGLDYYFFNWWFKKKDDVKFYI